MLKILKNTLFCVSVDKGADNVSFFDLSFSNRFFNLLFSFLSLLTVCNNSETSTVSPVDSKLKSDNLSVASVLSILPSLVNIGKILIFYKRFKIINSYHFIFPSNFPIDCNNLACLRLSTSISYKKYHF